MRFAVLEWFELELSYRHTTWVNSGVVDQLTDIYRFFMLKGTAQEFLNAMKLMKKPDLRSRLQGFWNSKPLVPYAAVWRDESVYMDCEIGAVRLRDSLSILLFGAYDQIRIGDQVELLSIEPRRQQIPISTTLFINRNILPSGGVWARDWIKMH